VRVGDDLSQMSKMMLMIYWGAQRACVARGDVCDVAAGSAYLTACHVRRGIFYELACRRRVGMENAS
jgi:hypothetical protein